MRQKVGRLFLVDVHALGHHALISFLRILGVCLTAFQFSQEACQR